MRGNGVSAIGESLEEEEAKEERGEMDHCLLERRQLRKMKERILVMLDY